jgi:hypothetical protein
MTATDHVRTRAKHVLINLMKPEFGIVPDGDGWMLLGCMSNVGPQTLKYLLDSGKIERRGDTQGYSYLDMARDRYRLLPAGCVDAAIAAFMPRRLPPGDPDFGDLWIE